MFENIAESILNENLFGSGEELKTTAGTNDLIVDTRTVTHNVSTYEEKIAYTINLSGTIRVKFDLKSSSNFAVYGRLYINGIAVGTERMKNNATYTTYTEDINVKAGDRLSLYLRGNTSNATASATNFKISIGAGILPTLIL